jgi:hypothetical protein
MGTVIERGDVMDIRETLHVPPRPAAAIVSAVTDALPDDPVLAMPADLRNRMIAEAAYYLAERRGFAPGYELEDWLAAEAEIECALESARIAAAAT